jgi:hypothetical protein
MRDLFAVSAIVFLALFGVLTFYVMATKGVTPLTVLAIVIIAFLGIGVYGAIRNPPR